MTVGGKHGNPNGGFPPFPPPLEIATRFPHSHRPDDPAYTHQRRPSILQKTVTHVAGLKCHLCPRPYKPLASAWGFGNYSKMSFVVVPAIVMSLI
jgi:hypothetical protein